MRPYICSNCNTITLREEINIMGNNGINTACFFGILALGIKFTKDWYLRQIKNRILARQKITNELKLLKARIQPEFLFESLHALYYKISTNKNQAAEMLLKFSELLSYMLYECIDDFVLIQRELIIISEFIALEKMMKETKLTVTTNIIGDISKKYIPSFIILPLIQNCVVTFQGNKDKEPHEVAIKIQIENGMLYCRMIIQHANAGDIREMYAAIVNTFINRLETFYANNYKLEFSEEEAGKFIITLTLLLLDNFSSDKIEEISENGYAYAHV